MSKKRQRPLFNPQGRPLAQLTTLSYDFPDGYVVPEHFHKQGQVLFASKGVMTVTTARGIWVVPPERAVWIPSGEAHSIAMSGVVPMRTLYFSPKLSRAISGECFVLGVSPLLRELILFSCTREAWRSRVRHDRNVIELVADQLKRAPVAPLRLPQPQDPRARRVVAALLEDPGDSRSLETACRKVGASRRTIERLFVEETGLTLGKWRQQLRLLHAMRLLASGEKVLSAALASGYNSPSAFISVFKKTLGQTPNQYFQSRVAQVPGGLFSGGFS